jgi:hypothetical protein
MGQQTGAETNFSHCHHSLTKEVTEAQKKLKDGSLEDEKKTFLSLQIPKMEAEIKSLKSTISELLDEQELDPRGEYYILAQKLIK